MTGRAWWLYEPEDDNPDVPLEMEFPELWPTGDDLDAIAEAEEMGIDGW